MWAQLRLTNMSIYNIQIDDGRSAEGRGKFLTNIKRLSVPAGSHCASLLPWVHELSVFNLGAALLTAVRGETGSPRHSQFTRLIGWRACAPYSRESGMSQHTPAPRSQRKQSGAVQH